MDSLAGNRASVVESLISALGATVPVTAVSSAAAAISVDVDVTADSAGMKEGKLGENLVGKLLWMTK